MYSRGMISAYHAYLIDPEFYRLDLEADRAQHRAELTSLAPLFCLLAPITSSTSHAQAGGSHFAALAGTFIVLHAAVVADDRARELDELRYQRHAQIISALNPSQP